MSRAGRRYPEDKQGGEAAVFALICNLCKESGFAGEEAKRKGGERRVSKPVSGRGEEDERESPAWSHAPRHLSGVRGVGDELWTGQPGGYALARASRL